MTFINNFFSFDNKPVMLLDWNKNKGLNVSCSNRGKSFNSGSLVLSDSSNSSGLFKQQRFKNIGNYSLSSPSLFNGLQNAECADSNLLMMNFSPDFDLSFNNTNNFTLGMYNNYRSSSSSLGSRIAENAGHYVGKVNSNAEGNRLFSGGRSRAWCADFVTAITKQSLGEKFPSDFGTATRNGHKIGSCSVYGLMYWAQDNDCYKTMPAKNRGDYIVLNVKPGDIMIEKAHTGIVTKVNSDGSFETVEGNYANKVSTVHHTANEAKVVGFISLEKYA